MKNHQPPPDTAITTWCLDWPLETRTPLTNNELLVLRGERVRCILIGVVLIPLFLLAFFGGLLFLAAPDLFGLPAHQDISSWGVLLVFLGLSAVPLVVANTSFQRAGMARKDARAGEKYRFTGPLTAAMCSVPIVRELTACGVITPAENQYIELLASGRLWAVSGVRAAGWACLPITRTAAVPEFAAIAAEWLDPIIDDAGNSPLRGGQRELSTAELAEVRRLARRHWLRPLLPALLLTAWCAPLLVLCLLAHRLPPELLPFLFLVTITLFVDYQLIMSIMMARRIRRDLAIRWVIIVRGPLTLRRHRNIIDDEQEHTVEILPSSGLLWTLDGEPADWRKRRLL